MPSFASFELTPQGLEIICSDAGLDVRRSFNSEDSESLDSFSKRHQELALRRRVPDQLLALGKEIFDWLNGPERVLERIAEVADTPLLPEFVVGRTDKSDGARAFLDAPWELLAQNGSHWAHDADKIYCPIRRIGNAGRPQEAAPHCLSTVFMAAAPIGADNLSFEEEEATILRATGNVPLDLIVEESGELGQLSHIVAREEPHAVHISCHGQLDPPGLLLENEHGMQAFTSTTDLVTRLGARHPRLLFLSAC